MADDSVFGRLVPNIVANDKLREPQRGAYDAICDHFSDSEKHREAGLVQRLCPHAPTRGTPPASGTGATDATVDHPTTTTTRNKDHEQR